jgi:hypothetical protein
MESVHRRALHVVRITRYKDFPMGNVLKLCPACSRQDIGILPGAYDACHVHVRLLQP